MRTERGEDRMARDFEEVARTLSGAEPPSLEEEAREARLAGRSLAGGGGDDLGRALDALGEQADRNERIAARMEEALRQMDVALAEMKGLQGDARDVGHAALQAALDGVNLAQEEAARITVKNVAEVTGRHRQYIRQLEEESRRRAERTLRATMPSRAARMREWAQIALLALILLQLLLRPLGGA